MAIEAFMLMRTHVLAYSHLSDAIQLFIVEGYIDPHLELTSFGISIRTADAFDPLCIEGNTIEPASSMDHLPKRREEIGDSFVVLRIPPLIKACNLR